MQITWRPSPSARSRSPTMRAVLPPTPASISSKTSVAPPAPACWSPQRASITRESSPPEAASRSGAASIPGFGAILSSTDSRAAGAEAVGVGLEHDLQRGARHRQLLELLRDPLLQGARRLGAAPR